MGILKFFHFATVEVKIVLGFILRDINDYAARLLFEYIYQHSATYH